MQGSAKYVKGSAKVKGVDEKLVTKTDVLDKELVVGIESLEKGKRVEITYEVEYIEQEEDRNSDKYSKSKGNECKRSNARKRRAE